MQLVTVRDSLDGLHRSTICLNGEHRAGLNRLAVNDDGARTAVASVTTDMCAGEVEVFSQEVDQKSSRFNVAAVNESVDCDVDFQCAALPSVPMQTAQERTAPCSYPRQFDLPLQKNENRDAWVAVVLPSGGTRDERQRGSRGDREPANPVLQEPPPQRSQARTPPASLRSAVPPKGRTKRAASPCPGGGRRGPLRLAEGRTKRLGRETIQKRRFSQATSAPHVLHKNNLSPLTSDASINAASSTDSAASLACKQSENSSINRLETSFTSPVRPN